MVGIKMLRISGFYDNSCTNGEGWRSVIFLSGCPHKCNGCQNPETWDYNSGSNIDVEALFQKIIFNIPFIDGVTLSGGEPFQKRYIKDLLLLIRRLKEESLSIWCYTGYTFEELYLNNDFYPLLENIDVLIDGKFELDKKDFDLRFVGSSNQRIIDVKSSLLENKICLNNL